MPLVLPIGAQGQTAEMGQRQARLRAPGRASISETFIFTHLRIIGTVRACEGTVPAIRGRREWFSPTDCFFTGRLEGQMQFSTLLVIAIFLSVYVGMALGPGAGLKVDARV